MSKVIKEKLVIRGKTVWMRVERCWGAKKIQGL
jgi:hypothetical protein